MGTRRCTPARRGVALLVALTAGCTTWHPTLRGERWTLYQPRGERAALDPQQLQGVIAMAAAAVEQHLGAFAQPVRIHLVGPDEVRGALLGWSAGASPLVSEIPGIGPARIPGWHTRSAAGSLAPSGVFVRVAEAGTLVHELVHARLDEEPYGLPLWFEEGIATFFGDGIATSEGWEVDGLACWPLRELRRRPLEHAEIESLLELEATDHCSLEENVLLHFLGWAVAFDLHRSSGSLDWKRWWSELDHSRLVEDVHARMARTLEQDTALGWLARLEDPDPQRRMAAAKGTWKLRTREVQRKLVDRLAHEDDPEVRAVLAVNALAATAELFGQAREGWRRILSVLVRCELEDPGERAAMSDLFRAYNGAPDPELARSALERLDRLWDE